MRPPTAFTAWQVAGAYAGTVVGAGFASGQEILRFFTLFGRHGIWGIALATALFALAGVATMRLGAAVAARSHRDVLVALGGGGFGGLADAVVTGFLFAGTGVMMAGAGAIAGEQFGLPPWVGSLALAVATLLTVLLGLVGVVRATAVVVPALIGGVVALTGYALLEPPPAPAPAGAAVATPAAPWWWLAAVLYASYNGVLALSVLAPLGRETQDARLQIIGGAAGAAALGLTAMLIHQAMYRQLGTVAAFEVPLLEVARRQSPLAGMGYALVLLAEIYTTAVAGLYGVTARLAPEGGSAYRWACVGLTAAAFALSRLGFADLVGTLYPLAGYLGIPVLGLLAVRVVRRQVP